MFVNGNEIHFQKKKKVKMELSLSGLNSINIFVLKILDYYMKFYI